MATTNTKLPCATCKKISRTFNCEGCTQGFCFDCLTKHLQELKRDLNGIDSEHEQFRQKLTEQKKDTKKRSLIQQVDQWEEDSINKIKQTAQNCRQRLINYRTRFLINLDNQLNNMTKQIKQFNQDSQFNETDLTELKDKLKYLKEELDKPPNVTIQLQPTTFIDKIITIIPFDKGRFHQL
jgi:DNA repair exonuclease SbcCD ATPase subunit